MLQEGYSLVRIKYDLSRQYKVSESTIESHYYEILKEISDVSSYEREAFRAKLIARAEFVYHKSINANQYRTALEANNAIAKLMGLYEHEKSQDAVPQIIEISGRTEDAPLKVVGGDSEADD